jgi:pimeloyl-ACP methyl ester carboxylesterase
MKLHTQTTGDGPTRIALIHGITGSGATWQPLADLAVATGRFTVITLDLRGHGQSGRVKRYRVSDFADDVVETLPEGLDAVVGHSLGGTVLWKAVSRLRPKRAVYLDPGFQLGLPGAGLRAKLFWAVPGVALLNIALQSRRVAEPKFGPLERRLIDDARAASDKRMVLPIMKDVSYLGFVPAKPAVPSALLLSGDAAEVVPPALEEHLVAFGWEVAHAPELTHSMWLADAPGTWRALEPLL